jgi:predicted NodU family carbamoyl transferase
MKLPIVILVLIIVSVFLLCSNNPKNEKFTTSHTDNSHVVFGPRYNNQSLLEDSLFSNVITYHNDDDPSSAGSRTALDKCMCHCTGSCVEFGPGFAAMCIV